MIGVYAICELKAEKLAEFESVAKNLVNASRQDKGWESDADLDLHTKQPHFTQAVEAFGELLAKDIEINVVELF